MRLGFISEKFESAGLGPATISHVADDPGGKSYGIYQLSKKTLWDYVQQAPFNFKASLFTMEFDKEWLAIAEKYTGEFALDQHLFITKRLYLPNIIFARSLGYDTWSRRIQESVYSIAVQHGGASQIIKAAFVANASVEAQVELLYEKRWEYVKGLSLSERIKEVLQNRYQNELKAVMKIEESDYVCVQ